MLQWRLPGYRATVPESFGFAPVEKALNVGDHQNQAAKQHHDLNGIVEKKLNTSAQPSAGIQSESSQQIADETIDPFHAKKFIPEKSPTEFYDFHEKPPFKLYIHTLKYIYMYSLNKVVCKK